jgi:excisionase family DNA binding protein
MAATSRRVVSISEAAELCQVTAETIRRWVDQGEIPSTRTLGGHRRIDLKDFQEFLKKKNLGKGKCAASDGSNTLVIGGNEQMTGKLARNIHDICPGTAVFVVQNPFEAGQRVALDEPDYVFFTGGIDNFDVSAAIRSIRENVRTRMIRIVTVGVGEINPRKTGADFALSDAGDKDILTQIYNYTEA